MMVVVAAGTSTLERRPSGDRAGDKRASRGRGAAWPGTPGSRGLLVGREKGDKGRDSEEGTGGRGRWRGAFGGEQGRRVGDIPLT